MAENKDNEGFFRKVVRFVANPATDWADLGTRQDDTREDLELEKSELKAMIERKRRNDFVRKREFDMLRKVRREGLSPEQLASLGGSSRLDDSEARMSDNAGAKPDGGVKAKIDEIEQQMVGGTFSPSGRRRLWLLQRTDRARCVGALGPAAARRAGVPLASAEPDALPALPPLPDLDLGDDAPATPAPAADFQHGQHARPVSAGTVHRWPALATTSSSSPVSASRSAKWCMTRTSTSR